MRTIQTMIDQEVIVCLSGLVSTLAGGFPSDLDGLRARDYAGLELREQAMELASPVLDYEEAAREAGDFQEAPHPDADGCFTFIERDTGKPCRTPHGMTPAEAFCNEYDIEPHEREVFEHWAVTGWFADKLEAAGEKVDRDFAGMAVWARTTTGQAIYMDAVIKRIYAEISAS